MRRRWKKAENANAGSAVSVDGACVLMARSGTAPRTHAGSATCRAPTGEKNNDENQERGGECAKQLRLCAAAFRGRRLKPTLLKGGLRSG